MAELHVGFTGNQKGMTPDQVRVVELLLSDLLEYSSIQRKTPVFHHGDCVGADAQAHAVASRLGYRVICHPGPTDSKRAFSQADEIREVKPELVRNQDIVDEITVIIGAPRQDYMVQRSGTWATLRRAKKKDTLRYVVAPNGSRVQF